MRLVILGGTFDPVHVGHLSLVRGSCKVLDASLGVIVVEGGHRHRTSTVATLDDRRRLVQLAIDGDESLREASQMGIVGGLVGAVAQLKDLGHEVHVVFGSDSAGQLDRWNGRQLLRGARLWAVPRPGDPTGDSSGVGQLAVSVESVSATQIRFAAAAGSRRQAVVPAPCRVWVDSLYGASVTDRDGSVDCESS
ncbi:MAG: adenylyltransferase/cytidyltransferase family protein [Ilumatobacteraceae bacterium]